MEVCPELSAAGTLQCHVYIFSIIIVYKKTSQHADEGEEEDLVDCRSATVKPPRHEGVYDLVLLYNMK